MARRTSAEVQAEKALIPEQPEPLTEEKKILAAARVHINDMVHVYASHFSDARKLSILYDIAVTLATSLETVPSPVAAQPE
jgi:hypothetical protein